MRAAELALSLPSYSTLESGSHTLPGLHSSPGSNSMDEAAPKLAQSLEGYNTRESGPCPGAM